MKVSVIIPVYNCVATLRRAVDSVLDQSFPIYELIAIDDGSTDGSIGAIASIDDPRLRIEHQANQGAGSARNRGLDLARGDWVAFLDSDDWWCSDRIADSVNALEADQALDFLQANRHYIDDRGGTRAFGATRASLRDPCALLSGFLIKTSAVMIRRELIEQWRLRFPTDQKTCEDYHLFWRAVVFARSVGFTEKPEVMIHTVPQSLSRGAQLTELQRDNIKSLIEVRTWARTHHAKRIYVDALTEHLHWQFRDFFAMLMRGRNLSRLVRAVALAVRHEGLLRSVRGLLSATRGLGTNSAMRAIER